jgi:hypothetical protein
MNKFVKIVIKGRHGYVVKADYEPCKGDLVICTVDGYNYNAKVVSVLSEEDTHKWLHGMPEDKFPLIIVKNNQKSA